MSAPGWTADWQARKEAGWQLLKGRSLTARLPELHLRTQAPRTRRTLVFGKGPCVCSTPPIFCSEEIESKGHLSQVNVCYDRLKWPQILCSFSHQEVGILSYSLNQGSHCNWLWPTERGGSDAVRLLSLGLCRLCSFLSLSGLPLCEEAQDERPYRGCQALPVLPAGFPATCVSHLGPPSPQQPAS